MILEEFDFNKQLMLEKKGGENRFALLLNKLIADGRIDNIHAIATDPQYRDLLFAEYNID